MSQWLASIPNNVCKYIAQHDYEPHFGVSSVILHLGYK